jgi:hypothetical protein
MYSMYGTLALLMRNTFILPQCSKRTVVEACFILIFNIVRIYICLLKMFRTTEQITLGCQLPGLQVHKTKNSPTLVFVQFVLHELTSF